MNFRTTIILTVVLLGALVFVFFAKQGEEANTDTTASTTAADGKGGRKLFELKADDVTKLSITPAEGGTGRPLQLAKVDGKWRVAQPIDWPATDWEVRSLVEAVTGLRSRGAVELNAANAAAAGLDKPRYRVELTDAKGGVTTLAVGNRSEIGADVFVRVGDAAGGELASGATLSSKLEKGTDKLLAELRDKQLVRTTSTDVKQLELTQRDGRRLVLHKDGTSWKLVEPQAVPADADEVANLISAVTNLRAEEFADAGAASAGGAQLDRPRAKVTLSTTAPATQPATAPAKPPAAAGGGGVTVAFGQPTDVDETKVWVSVSEPASVAKASMSTQSLERLTKASPLTLRDKKVLDLDPEQVAEVSLSIDRPSTTQPATQPADVRQFRIARRKESLALGPALPAGPATAPSTGPSTSPTTGPATAPASQPAEVKEPSKWVLASEGNADADEGQVSDLLSSLHPLRVEKYVDPAAAATQPATRPTPTYTLVVKTIAPGGAEATHELQITDPGGEAKLTGRLNDLSFELGRDLLKKLDGDFKTPKPADTSSDAPTPSFGGPGGGGFPGLP